MLRTNGKHMFYLPLTFRMFCYQNLERVRLETGLGEAEGGCSGMRSQGEYRPSPLVIRARRSALGHGCLSLRGPLPAQRR